MHLIDLALDLWDKEWFERLTDEDYEYQLSTEILKMNDAVENPKLVFSQDIFPKITKRKKVAMKAFNAGKKVYYKTIGGDNNQIVNINVFTFLSDLNTFVIEEL